VRLPWRTLQVRWLGHVVAGPFQQSLYLLLLLLLQMKRLVSMKSGGSSPDMSGKTIIMVSSNQKSKFVI
jgi:hypothetical protein